MRLVEQKLETRAPLESGQIGERSLRAPQVSSLTLQCRWSVAFLGATVLVVSGHLLIKGALNATALAAPGTSLWKRLGGILFQPLTLEGLFIYALGSLCWMVAVAQKDVSYLYPLTSLNYVLVALASVVLFQESLSIRRGAGIVLITLGVLLMNRGSRLQRA